MAGRRMAPLAPGLWPEPLGDANTMPQVLRLSMKKEGVPTGTSSFLVRVTGFEPAASWSQTTRATSCATPGRRQNGLTPLRRRTKALPLFAVCASAPPFFLSKSNPLRWALIWFFISLSLRTSDRRHWCGNPFSFGTGLDSARSPEIRIPTPVCALARNDRPLRKA